MKSTAAPSQTRGGHQHRTSSHNHAGNRKTYASSALAGQIQQQQSAEPADAGCNVQAATSHPSGTSTASTSSVQISSLIGQLVVVSLHVGEDTAATLSVNGEKARQSSIQGKLWAFDDRIGTLVLQTSPSGIRMIMLHAISSISIISPLQSSTTANFDIVEEPFTAIPAHIVKEREEAAVRDEVQRVARLPPSGSLPIAGEIFEALGKTLPVRWADKTIVVMDEVLVDPPYTSASCRSENPTRLARVQKVLQGERSRIDASLSESTPTSAIAVKA